MSAEHTTVKRGDGIRIVTKLNGPHNRLYRVEAGDALSEWTNWPTALREFYTATNTPLPNKRKRRQ